MGDAAKRTEHAKAAEAMRDLDTTAKGIAREDCVRAGTASMRIDGGDIAAEVEALLDQWAKRELSDDALAAAAIGCGCRGACQVGRAQAAHATGLISGVFDALRPAEPAVRPPWGASVPMAERVRAIQERAAKAKEQTAKPPQAETDVAKSKPKPRR